MEKNRLIREDKMDISETIDTFLKPRTVLFWICFTTTVILLFWGTTMAIVENHIPNFTLAAMAASLTLVPSIVLWRRISSLKKDKATQEVLLYDNRINSRSLIYNKHYLVDLAFPLTRWSIYENNNRVYVKASRYEELDTDMYVIVVIGKYSKMPLDVYPNREEH